MAALHSRNVFCFDHLPPLISEPRQQPCIVAAAQCRVRLFRRPKIMLYAKMDLDSPACEPATATRRQFGWFRDFCHAQQVGKKAPPGLLLARWHRELNVIEIDKRSFAQASNDKCILMPTPLSFSLRPR